MQRSILGWCLVASLLFLSFIPVTVSAAQPAKLGMAG